MHCRDTGKQESYHVPGVKAAEAYPIIRAVAAVRAYENGTGEVCIPLVNGVLKKLRITIEDFLDGLKKK